MTKKSRIILVTVILILLIIYSAFLLVNNIYGPEANDKVANEKRNMIKSIVMPAEIIIRETTDFIGKWENDEQFIIWVGTVIETDLSKQELELAIKALPEFEKAEIFPYELALANKLRFTGIQKEVWGTDAEGIYIIVIEVEPKTTFDKRNK